MLCDVLWRDAALRARAWTWLDVRLALPGASSGSAGWCVMNVNTFYKALQNGCMYWVDCNGPFWPLGISRFDFEPPERMQRWLVGSIDMYYHQHRPWLDAGTVDDARALPVKWKMYFLHAPYPVLYTLHSPARRGRPTAEGGPFGMPIS